MLVPGLRHKTHQRLNIIVSVVLFYFTFHQHRLHNPNLLFHRCRQNGLQSPCDNSLELNMLSVFRDTLASRKPYVISLREHDGARSLGRTKGRVAMLARVRVLKAYLTYSNLSAKKQSQNTAQSQSNLPS